jgi:hypothetical protein
MFIPFRNSIAMRAEMKKIAPQKYISHWEQTDFADSFRMLLHLNLFAQNFQYVIVKNQINST